jgi:hypothetical protein
VTDDAEHFDLSGSYLDLLQAFHQSLRPRTYLEIGVNAGRSLALIDSQTRAVGVDPAPIVDRPISKGARVVRATSDDFFREHTPASFFGTLRVDLGFIDGMHLAEFAFRDFRNLERWSDPESLILLHDILPPTPACAARTPQEFRWAGDVFKVLAVLVDLRPDLDISVARVGPTGLAIIRSLDPNSQVLFEREDEALARMLQFTYNDLVVLTEQRLRVVAADWESICEQLGFEPFPPTPGPQFPTRYPRTFRATRRRLGLAISSSKVAPLLRRLREAG